MIDYLKHYGGFWIRIFGYGVSVVDRSKNEALFSERNGHTNVLRIGRYAITALGRRGWTA